MRRRCLLFFHIPAPKTAATISTAHPVRIYAAFFFDIDFFFCQHPCTLPVLFADVVQFHHLLINRPGHCRLRFICGRRRRSDNSKTYVMFFPFSLNAASRAAESTEPSNGRVPTIINCSWLENVFRICSCCCASSAGS